MEYFPISFAMMEERNNHYGSQAVLRAHFPSKNRFFLSE